MQSEFNREGKDVWEKVLEYERRLCSFSEGGQYAKFSYKLSEKFRNEVKKKYPKIEFIGVKIGSNDPFSSLRRIKLG